MAGSGTQSVAGEPGEVRQDPKAAAGVQRGGLTPEVARVLESIDPTQRSIIEADIRQRNKHLTSEQQRLAQDVQLADILRNFMKDPQFQGYIDARQSGTEAKFFASELEAAGVAVTKKPGDNPKEVGLSSDQAQDDDTAALPPAVQARLDELEKKQKAWEDSRAKEAQEVRAQAFIEAHPDYEDFLPAMTSIDNRYKAAGSALELEDLFYLAKREAASGFADLDQVEEGQQQAPASDNAASSTDFPTEPDGTGDAVPPRGRRIASVFDAFQAAKKQELGTTDEIFVRYS